MTHNCCTIQVSHHEHQCNRILFYSAWFGEHGVRQGHVVFSKLYLLYFPLHHIFKMLFNIDVSHLRHLTCILMKLRRINQHCKCISLVDFDIYHLQHV